MPSTSRAHAVRWRTSSPRICDSTSTRTSGQRRRISSAARRPSSVGWAASGRRPSPLSGRWTATAAISSAAASPTAARTSCTLLGQQPHQPLAQQRGVLRQDHPHGSSASIGVEPPGGLVTGEPGRRARPPGGPAPDMPLALADRPCRRRRRVRARRPSCRTDAPRPATRSRGRAWRALVTASLDHEVGRRLHRRRRALRQVADDLHRQRPPARPPGQRARPAPRASRPDG